MKQLCSFASVVLLSLSVGCGGPPLDKVFAEHEAQLDECLGYRLDAEARGAEASAVLGNPLAGPGVKQDAQILKSTARTLSLTHDACVTRLLESAALTAADMGVSPEELKAAWPEWYDGRAAARAR